MHHSILLDCIYSLAGPGGHWQWRVRNALDAESHLMRLTSDMALVTDDIYKGIVQDTVS